MSYYRIARIVNTYGIRGAVKVISETDFPEERFAQGEKLVILINKNQSVVEVTVANSRIHKGTYIIEFEEFNNINDVEPFKNNWLAIRESQQHELEEDEYYYHEIIGLKVVTTEGKLLGTIKDILALGSNDVWVVERPEINKTDALLPYIDDVVKEIDLTKQTAYVELMEGLIEDED